MPQVPRYQQVIEEKPLPSIRTNQNPDLAAFGGGESLSRVVNSTTNLIGSVDDYMEREKARADKVKFDQSRIALDKWERDNIYDPRTGASGTVGEQAFGIEDSLSNSLSKFTEDYKKTLGNKRQQDMFDGLVAERWNHVDTWAKKHVARQRDVVEEATFTNGLESSKDRAVYDKSLIPMEMERIKSEIFNRYNGKFSPESNVIQQEIQKHETDLHRRIVDDYIAKGEDVLAEGYFASVKDRIDPDKVNGFEDKIKSASARIKKEKLENLSRSALDIIENTKDFDSLPKNVVDALPLESRRALRAYAKTIQKGDGVDTDLVLWYQKVGEATTPGEVQKAFAEEDLTKYVDKLGTSEFKNLVSLQSAIRSGRGNVGDNKVLDGYRTDAQIVGDVLRSVGLNPNPNPNSNRKQAEKVALFHKAVDEGVMNFQATTGKKATNEDVQRIAEGLVMKGSLEGTGFGGFFRKQKMAFEVLPGEKIVATKDDIPDADMAQIKAALLNNNIEPSDENIVNLYNKKLSRNVTRQ